MSMYQDIILDHYRNPRNFGKLEKADHTVSVSNPLCGDKISMEIIEEGDIIHNIAFSGEGCAISKAAASMLTEYVKGKSKDELRKLDKSFIMEMLGLELSPNRIKCALLSWEALIKILSSTPLTAG